MVRHHDGRLMTSEVWPAVTLSRRGFARSGRARRSGIRRSAGQGCRNQQKRGASTDGAATVGHAEIAKEAESVIYIPKIDPLLLASLEVVPFQLYAYYVALYNGCDIDKPRNLAKSVTVE